MVYTKNEKGISLLTLIITIVVIIIFSVMAMTVNNTVVDSGIESKFKQEITDIKKGVETIKLINSKEGIDEKTLNKGFIKVKVSGDNVPNTFVSFDSGEKTAYLVDLEKIDYKKLKTGHGYKEIEENETVFFGIDDVYIYDKEGNVYYLKGAYLDGEKPSYTTNENKTYGPKVSAENVERGKIKIEVTPTKGGEITSVTVDGKTANKVNEINGTQIYEYEVSKNGTYTVLATEKENGTTKVTVKVTKLEDKTDKKADATYGNIKINNSDEEEQYTINKNATLNIDTDADLIYIKHVTTGSTPTPPTSITPGWEKTVASKNLYLSEGKNKIYVWFRNSGSNVILDDYKSITLESIPDSSSIPVPSIEYAPKNDYTEKVTVTITYPEATKDNKYEKWYRISEGEWKVSIDVEISLEIEENTKIDAVVVRKISGQTILGKIVSVTINNIDNNAPQIGEITLEAAPENDGTKIIGTTIIKDNETKVVEYAVTNEDLTPTNWQNISNPEKEVTLTVNLEAGNTYYIWAKDECGNISKKEVFAQIEYEVTFDANGGLIGDFESVTRKVIYGKTYGEILEGMPIATKYGHTFLGWSKVKNNSGDRVIPDTIVTGEANNQTLYAIWSEEAIAIYSKTDNSLRFYKTAITPKEGEIYKDKIVTNIYFGVETSTYNAATDVPWYNVRGNIKSVIIQNTVSPVSTAYWFNEMENLETAEMANLDTSKVKTMQNMFMYCSKLITLNGEEKWDTSNVENMRGVFSVCTAIKSLEVSNWNTSNVTNMRATFQVCTSLTELDLSKWDVSKVTTMYGMFLSVELYGDMKLTTIGDVSNWNTANVIEMEGMFQRCASFKTIDASDWVLGKVKNMRNMFYNCTSLETVHLSNWNVSSVTNIDSLFQECTSLKQLDLRNWSVSKVTSMYQTFAGMSNLEEIYIDSWNTESLTTIDRMFTNCKKLKNLNLSSFNTSKVTNMYGLFSNCTSLESLNLSNFNTSSVNDMNGMFNNCNKLQEVTLGPNFNFVGENGYLPAPSDEYIPGADGNWYDTNTWIGYAPNEIPERTEATTYVAVNLNPGEARGVLVQYFKDPNNPETYEYNMHTLILCTPTEEELSGMIYDKIYKGLRVDKVFQSNQIGGDQAWDRLGMTYNQWMDMKASIKRVIVEDRIILNKNSRYLFGDFTNLEEIQNIEKLNTANVTAMTSMFSDCGTLTNLDLTSFNTENVTDMSSMFHNCISLTSIKLNNWNTKNVTTTVDMFSSCISLTSLDLSSFDTTNLTTRFEMFEDCVRLQEVTLGPNFKWKGTDGYLPVPSAEYIEGADGKWYDTKTGIGYIPSNMPERTEVTTYTAISPLIERAVAVYSKDDKSLTFYRTTDQITEGKDYNGKEATKVYTGFEDAQYTSKEEVPWNDSYGSDGTAVPVRENTFNVFLTAEIKPISTAYWFVRMNVKTLDLTNLNMSNVVDMTNMFENCTSLSSITGEENWDTGKVTSMAGAFLNCRSLETIEPSNWNTENVTNMSRMFEGHVELTSLDLSNWNVGNVQDMSYMFKNALVGSTGEESPKLSSIIGINNWDTKNVINMQEMFHGCNKIPNFGGKLNWNVEKVENMLGMFKACKELEILDLSSWNTASLTDATRMFFDCRMLKEVTLGPNYKWVGTKGYLPTPSATLIPGSDGLWYDTNTAIGYLAENIPERSVITTYVAYPLKGVAIYSVDDASLRFYKVAKIPSVGERYNGKLVTAVYEGFEETNYEAISEVPWSNMSEDISSVEFINEIKPKSTAYWFANLKYATKLDVTNLNTANVKSMKQMFAGFAQQAEGNISLDLSSLDTSNVEDMSYMFITLGDGENVSITLNINGWNTEEVTNMSYMFSATGVVDADLSTLDTSSVEDMSYMFNDAAIKIEDCGLNSWNVKNVKYMDCMFFGLGQRSGKINYLDLSNWETESLRTASSMFDSAKIVKLNLNNLYTRVVTNMDYMFHACIYLQEVTLGQNFERKGSYGYLPVPSDENIEGATGYWYNSNGEAFAPEEIPNKVAGTYTAIPTTYKVRFEANGGNIYDLGDTWTERDVTAGSTYGAKGNFPEAYRDGYEFLGWYTSGDEEKQITAETKVDKTAEGLVLYAKWEEGEAFAIYSTTDKSLTFYKAKTVPKEGSTYNDKAVTMLYTGIEDTAYDIENKAPWYTYRGSIYKIVFENKVSPKSTAYWFYHMTSAGSIDVTKLDTSKVEDMSYMFAGAGQAPNKTFLPGNVEDSFSIIGLENFDTSRVTSMKGMFRDTASPGPSDTHEVINVSIGNISNWNTSNVKNMSYMFSAFAEDVKVWEILGDLSKKIVNGIDETTYVAWDTSNVIDMSWMFYLTGYYSDSFKLTGLDTWNVSNVKNMEYMFAHVGLGAETWSIGDLSNWNTSNVIYMNDIFKNAGEFATTWSVGNLGRWNTSNVINMSYMFAEAGRRSLSWYAGDLSAKLVTKENGESYIAWDTSKVVNMDFMFSRVADNIDSESDFNIGNIIGTWDTSAVTSMYYMFFEALPITNTYVGSCHIGETTTEEITVGEKTYRPWDTSNVTNMERMFQDVYFIELDCSKWNVNNVTRHEYFNADAPGIIEPIWND